MDFGDIIDDHECSEGSGHDAMTTIQDMAGPISNLYKSSMNVWLSTEDMECQIVGVVIKRPNELKWV